MVTITEWHLLVFMISRLFTSFQMQLIMRLEVDEEVPEGFVIGNIKNFVTSHFYVSNYEVTCLNKYFSISSNKVIMKKVIDLEKICDDESLCCNDGPCILDSTVYLSSDNSMKNTFKIEIVVKDINDNDPMFKNPNQNVSIQENMKVNTYIRLEAAVDNDVSLQNKVQRYHLTEPTNTFQLDSADLEFLKLYLQKPVDYEKVNVYKAKLSACDLKNKCTIQNLIIQIEDENDNFPKFEKSKYQIKIKESVEVKSVILQVRAIDIDGARFNKTIYSLYSSSDRGISRIFEVDSGTGNIILKNKLSASSKVNYRFKVSAVDALLAPVGDNMDLTEVIIDVIDVNDHKPIIELLNPKNVTEDGQLLRVNIKENQPPQKLISMKVSDPDLGDNAQVDCSLKEGNSAVVLKFFNYGLYELWSDMQFDHEKETSIRILFDCRDKGTPIQYEYRTIEINIEDVNEHQPVFQKLEYSVNLKENSSPGTYVVKVEATDKDGMANLTYFIPNNVKQYFTIDRETGLIKTSFVSFDREVIESKEFYVTVNDDKENPKTSEALVRVRILDVNDNDPIFIVSSLKLYVSENQQIKTKLDGKLNATDLDKDKDNSFVMFKIVKLYDHLLMKCDQQVFVIKTSGEIETMIELDRETNPNYTMTVKVEDKGVPPRHSIANATVYVRDLNDNAPEWRIPRQNYKNTFHTMPILNISESIKKRALIMKLNAIDRDENEAGRVSYILYNHHEGMFAINETTGELITLTSPLRNGQHKLQIKARDHGTPFKETDLWFLINVLDNGNLANINLTIIVGLIAITVLISIFLIIAIICVRRRPRFQKYLNPSTEIPNDNSSQYFNHNHWIYQPEENPIPPISDNESFVFLPQTYLSSNHPDSINIQPMNCSRPHSRMEYPLTLPSSNNFNIIDNRINGTLRSNNGFYGSNIQTSMGVIINGQELDGDSADSGKGASEVDLRLQHQLNIVNRNYTTMPFLHYSTATTSFGHYNNLSPNQYYSINTNPRSKDSRFLNANTTNLQSGVVASPSNSNCQCFILPEDDVIQINQDNEFSMNTFSNKSKLINHENNCIYIGDDISPPTGHFYKDYTYGEASGNAKDYIVRESSEGSNDVRNTDMSFNNLSENIHNKNLFIASDKNNLDKKFYSVGMAN